jgi:hypothetical protein
MPNDESRLELPSWLPWATTACLAALVACLGELWIIERARSQLNREQYQLADAALKGAENQLEAERIVDRRALAGLRSSAAQPGLRAAMLAPPGAGPAPAPAFGVVAWDPSAGRGLIGLGGLPGLGPDRDYQLWLENPGKEGPSSCGVFHPSAAGDGAFIAVTVSGAAAPGCRFLLVDAIRGGARTLDEAKARGSIVLASLPFDGKIPGR